MLSGITKIARTPSKLARAEVVKYILRLRIATAAFFMSSRHIPAIVGALVVFLVVLSHAESNIVVFSKAGLLVIAVLALLGDWLIEYHFLKKHMELRNLFVRIDARNEKRRTST